MATEEKEIPGSKWESYQKYKKLVEHVGTLVDGPKLGENDPPPEELMERDGRPTLSPDGTG